MLVCGLSFILVFGGKMNFIVTTLLYHCNLGVLLKNHWKLKKKNTYHFGCICFGRSLNCTVSFYYKGFFPNKSTF